MAVNKKKREKEKGKRKRKDSPRVVGMSVVEQTLQLSAY